MTPKRTVYSLFLDISSLAGMLGHKGGRISPEVMSLPLPLCCFSGGGGFNDACEAANEQVEASEIGE